MSMDEVSRIKKTYAKRELSGKSKLYSYFNPASLFSAHQRETAIIVALRDNNINDLSDKRILDLGCGFGGILRDFVKYGASPPNCYGVDLIPDRVNKAREISPNLNISCGNAEKLSFQDAHFDIVLCFTVFTSVLDSKMRYNLAAEILRVLKPGGILIWYDYHVNNPGNPDVRGMKRKEIYKLFPGCEIYLKRITLAPPLARAIAPFSVMLCQILEKIPLLCTHYLGVVRRI